MIMWIKVTSRDCLGNEYSELINLDNVRHIQEIRNGYGESKARFWFTKNDYCDSANGIFEEIQSDL